MASPSHDRHNFFRREIHDETKAFIWKIIVDLHLGFLMGAGMGFEPMISNLWGWRDDLLLYPAMVPMAGIEPATSSLWGTRSKPTELHGQIQDAKEKIVGFEPTTDCLTDNYSTKWVKYFLKRKNCCVRLYYGCWSPGVEPGIAWLWARNGNPFHPPAMVLPRGFEPLTPAWKADDLGRLSMGA